MAIKWLRATSMHATLNSDNTDMLMGRHLTMLLWISKHG